jgi:hypothetical protein
MSFAQPTWMLLLVGLGALAYAAALYARDRGSDDPSWRRWRPWLAGLRFLAAGAVLLLLLDPVWQERRTETEAPLVLVALDASASAVATDSAGYAAAVDQLDELQRALGNDFEVRSFAFGETLEERAPGAPALATAPGTDLSAALDGLEDRFAGRNVGAVVLATDGLANRGRPVRGGGFGLPAPVYGVGLGDTTRRRDLRVERVLANRLVYLGDRFALRAEWSGHAVAGERVRLTVEAVDAEGGTRQLAQRERTVEGTRWSATEEWVLEADRAGVQRLRVTVSPVTGEASVANNRAEAWVEVIDGRQRVLLLADAPHPDLGALRQTLENRGRYEVRVVLAKDFDGTLEDLDLLVLHQLPSLRHPLPDLAERRRAAGLPGLYVLGAHTDLEAFSRQQPLLRVRAGNGSLNEVQARVNPDFALFKPSAEGLSAWPSFPPIGAPFGDYRTAPEARVLLRQRIGRVETDYPLLLFGEQGGLRTGVLAAEGIWRWRLHDYQQSGNHERVDELLAQTVQYLGVKGDRRRFTAAPDRNLYAEREPVRFRAELYNANYEPVNDPDATLVLRGPDGQRYDFRFTRRDAAYALDAGVLPPADYSYRAETRLDGETLVAEGLFTVRPLQLERVRLEADHGVLMDLAASTNGRFFRPSAEGLVPAAAPGAAPEPLATSLATAIRADGRAKPLLHEVRRSRSVIHWRAMFGGLLLLLGLEWFLRKWLGGV